MHTGPVPELHGTLGEKKPSDRRCYLCGNPMDWQLWSSGDGACEDDKYTCTVCGHVEWVDGIDS